MTIHKNKFIRGIWCEDKDRNFINAPSGNDISYPENAVVACQCHPLWINIDFYRLKDYDGVHTYRREDRSFTKCVSINGWKEDTILAMVNSGDYTLNEALTIFAYACNRCQNALAYKYLDGTAGYAEYSDEWVNDGHKCDFCKDMR